MRLAYALATSKDPLMAPPPATLSEEEGGCYTMKAVYTFLGKPVPAVCAEPLP
jgi:hypothetical protein